MKSLLTLILLSLATAATAQGLPALFDVTGVASDDVLNVRENPRASAPRLGGLAPDATGIEVVALSDSGDWGRINLGEGSGWVSMRYLAAQPADRQTYFDTPLRCLGTEPFWLVSFDDGIAIFSAPGLPPTPFEITTTSPAIGSGLYAQLAAGEELTAVVKRAECSDGMSDRSYGLSGDIILTEDGEQRLLTGCCTLAPPG